MKLIPSFKQIILSHANLTNMTNVSRKISLIKMSFKSFAVTTITNSSDIDPKLKVVNEMPGAELKQ